MPQEPPDSERVYGEPSDIDRPIFIVGCPRSGTTILRLALDSHPRISAGPEEATLYWLQRNDNDVAGTRRAGYGVSEEQWCEMVRGIVESVQRPYAESQRKTRWALKHPELALVIPWVDKVYPDSQIIHIVRHPRDVIASNQRKFGPRKGVEYGDRWVRYVRSAETEGARLGSDRFRTIRYEDLASEPERVLRDTVEWLGEPWSEDVLWPHGRTHEFPVVRREKSHRVSINANSIGRGRYGAPRLALTYVWLEGSDLTEKMGYKVTLASRGSD
jgi:Sulfotransferase family